MNKIKDPNIFDFHNSLSITANNMKIYKTDLQTTKIIHNYFSNTFWEQRVTVTGVAREWRPASNEPEGSKFERLQETGVASCVLKIMGQEPKMHGRSPQV